MNISPIWNEDIEIKAKILGLSKETLAELLQYEFDRAPCASHGCIYCNWMFPESGFGMEGWGLDCFVWRAGDAGSRKKRPRDYGGLRECPSHVRAEDWEEWKRNSKP